MTSPVAHVAKQTYLPVKTGKMLISMTYQISNYIAPNDSDRETLDFSGQEWLYSFHKKFQQHYDKFTFIYKLLIQLHVSLKLIDISGKSCSCLCNSNFNYCPYRNLSQCLHKLDPKICELWAALVQLHDSQFPGQVRKADMNKNLCVSFISGKNLGGKEMSRVRLESL